MTHIVRGQFTAHDRKIFWVLATIGVVALFSYIYFISIAVLSVVGRKEAERQTGRISAEVANLESKYAALDRSIDLAAVEAEGFREVARPRYVSRESDREVLTLRDAEKNR